MCYGLQAKAASAYYFNHSVIELFIDVTMYVKDSYRNTVGSSVRLTDFFFTIIKLTVNGERSLMHKLKAMW